MNLYQAIKEYVTLLKSGEGEARGGTLLIGEGCSLRSGMPTGQALVKLIQERFPDAVQGEDQSPEACLARLTSNQKVALQETLLEKASINWAYICIALMMRDGYIRRVLTTNTHPLLERACSLVNVFPAVYDCSATTGLDPTKVAGTAIFHLNGQVPGGTPGDLAPVYAAANEYGPWFVVGYSDQDDDPVFQQLTQVEPFKNGLLWVLPKNISPSRSVHERILTKGKEVEYTNAKDADAFLILIMQELKVEVPGLIAYPFSHLGDALRKIAYFPAPGMVEEMHVVDIALQQIKLAIKDYEGGEWGDLVEGELDMDVLNEPALLSALQAAQAGLVNGDAQKIIGQRAQYDKTPNPQLGDLLIWAYLKEGDDAYYKAQSGDETAAAMRERAREYYEQALNLQPDGSEIVFKLGKLLAQQGHQVPGEESKALLAQATEKFKQTLALNPDLLPARLQLGNALVDLAAQSPNGEADELFGEAIDQYQTLLELEPENVEAAFGCGMALYAQARKKKGAEALRLYGQAAEKLSIGLKYQPNRIDALLPMAHSLLVFSRSKKGEEADRMLAMACEKFQYACQVKPEMPEAHFGWADALFERASSRTDAKASDFFELALDQYKTTVRLKPDLPRVHFRWGLALFQMAQRKDGTDSTRLYQLAAEKFQTAVKLNPQNIDAYLRLGRIHVELAGSRKGADADKVYDRAIDYFQAVLKLQPKNADAMSQVGVVFLNKARLKEATDAESDLREAMEKCKMALELKPGHFQATLVWGESLLEMGLNRVDPDAWVFEEAEEKLQAALKLQPNNADVLVGLAHCLLNKARNMDAEKAAHALEEGLNHVQTVLEEYDQSAPARNIMAAILMEQARSKRGINAHPLLAEAKGHLQRAEDLQPGSATYNMARLMAQLNNESGCREWLEKCKANGVLPSSLMLTKDPLLEPMRESKWFKKLAGLGSEPKEEKAQAS
ncbi:tetratricopeptide repeat protein [Nitrospina gracilis]|uniref:tetratricopeptide repeat protein n=1 Tax=Nitrospina gracilis TaxID=35801 RepID=UPI001F180E1B|nr:tetratricopeptide repeat protein [Nitrospina gracilis]MCF8719270.1 tetratricopeptide (TPR) repeat protein [Nitrospina gracilis Nb-211]